MPTPARPAKRIRVEGTLSKSPDHYDPDGDLDIISSDNVVFKVHAYHFQASSSVFRAMIELGKKTKDHTIELDDPDFENAFIIDLVLEIMLKHKNIFDIRTTYHRRIIRFIDKYDLERQRESIHANVAVALLSRETDLLDIFELAVWLRDWKMCGLAIEHSVRGEIENDRPLEEEERQFGAIRGGANIFDPTAMGYDRFQSLPTGVLWALSRASAKIPSADDDEFVIDYIAAGREFERLMNLPGAPRDV